MTVLAGAERDFWRSGTGDGTWLVQLASLQELTKLVQGGEFEVGVVS